MNMKQGRARRGPGRAICKPAVAGGGIRAPAVRRGGPANGTSAKLNEAAWLIGVLELDPDLADASRRLRESRKRRKLLPPLLPKPMRLR